MIERVHAATRLTSNVDIRNNVSQTEFEPPYPENGTQLQQVLWHAGELQLLLDVRVEVIEKNTDAFDLRLVRRDDDWTRFYGPFTLAQLPVYLRGLADGFRYAVRK